MPVVPGMFLPAGSGRLPADIMLEISQQCSSVDDAYNLMRAYTSNRANRNMYHDFQTVLYQLDVLHTVNEDGSLPNRAPFRRGIPALHWAINLGNRAMVARVLHEYLKHGDRASPLLTGLFYDSENNRYIDMVNWNRLQYGPSHFRLPPYCSPLMLAVHNGNMDIARMVSLDLPGWVKERPWWRLVLEARRVGNAVIKDTAAFYRPATLIFQPVGGGVCRVEGREVTMNSASHNSPYVLSALEQACLLGHLGMATIIASAGAIVKRHATRNSGSILHKLCAHGYDNDNTAQVLLWLLDQGSGIDDISQTGPAPRGLTPLQVAVTFGTAGKLATVLVHRQASWVPWTAEQGVSWFIPGGGNRNLHHPLLSAGHSMMSVDPFLRLTCSLIARESSLARPVQVLRAMLDYGKERPRRRTPQPWEVVWMKGQLTWLLAIMLRDPGLVRPSSMEKAWKVFEVALELIRRGASYQLGELTVAELQVLKTIADTSGMPQLLPHDFNHYVHFL